MTPVNVFNIILFNISVNVTPILMNNSRKQGKNPKSSISSINTTHVNGIFKILNDTELVKQRK